MPMRRRFYDPIVQAAPVEAPQEEPSRPVAVLIEKPGLYMHVSDIASELRRGAAEWQAAGETKGADALLAAADGFEAAEVVE